MLSKEKYKLTSVILIVSPFCPHPQQSLYKLDEGSIENNCTKSSFVNSPIPLYCDSPEGSKTLTCLAS